MSRHKIVKNLDLDDELDDYDGADYEDEGGEELTEEDKENMRVGTIAVREALGDGVPGVTDKDIQEALWHYYYDVEKSVNYLIQSRMPKEEKKKKVKVSRFMDDDLSPPPTAIPTKHFDMADFWKDMGWLNTPADRQTTFIEPLYPRGGLLGGNPDAPPKMSKLQALAAARKKKAEDAKKASAAGAASDDVAKPMAGLSLDGAMDSERRSETSSSAATPAPETPRRLNNLKRKDSSPHRSTPRPPTPQQEPPPAAEPIPEEPKVEAAPPSAFAMTMFGHNLAPAPRAHANTLFSLPYVVEGIVQSADAFAGPSPDDVVKAAQSKAAGAKKVAKPQKTKNEAKADQIAAGVESMKIDDTPRARSKNLDVLEEHRKKEAKHAANFVVIGHVDAGKSTLMGRLLHDLNVVDQRTIEKYKKEAEKLGKSSFALAWVMDQGTEERARGVTIDIAMNKFDTDKTTFTILDAPGHKDFIPNMIAGASQADFAVMVIDASTGSFESGLKGQTKEHALLVRSMGVQRLIIAVNKLDTVGWSKDRFDEISQQVSAFLTQAGFNPKNVSFVPCSGLLGDNITRRSEDPRVGWYSGKTLVEELDASEPVTRALEKPLRVTIGDIFRGGVQNPLSISGRIESGSLQTGDALLAQPSGEKCYVKGLEVDHETADWAVAGQNATIHLSGIDPIHLKVGDVLCSPTTAIQITKSLTVKILAFQFLMPSGIDVHRGRMHAPGRVAELIATLDKATGKVIKKKPKIVQPGQVARVKVELDSAVPLEKGQRVVLRSGGDTIGAGLIE